MPYEISTISRNPQASLAPAARRGGLSRTSTEFPATFHVTEISADAALHYHKQLTEVYYFLECGPNAQMQLDGEFRAVKPGMYLF